MYTIEKLKQLNPSYDSEHRVTQSDAEKANRYIEAIQNSRSDTQIQVGDIVEVTTKHGDYYQNAHIESYNSETDNWSVCEQPYVPFVYLNDKGMIRCSTSGGAWCGVPNKLVLIGKRAKQFKDFGHCGACGNGAFCFEAEVNVWEYKESESLYGDYTTKEWRKEYISYCTDEYGNTKNGSHYRYFRDGITFGGKEDYEAWLKTYKGVEFKGHWINHTVVFRYRERNILITKEEWDALDLPKDTRLCNGVNLCKVRYDDEKHIVEVFRFSNTGTMDWREYKSYELARGRDLGKDGY